MRVQAIATALLLLIAEPARASAQGIGGLVKKAGEAAKNANNKKEKTQEPSAEQQATQCNVSGDAYDRLLKGMEAETDGLKRLGEEYATAKVGSNKYKQCQISYGTGDEYQKIVNRPPPSQNMSAEQMIKWMQDKTAGADSAMAKKCGKDPIQSWTSGDRGRMIEEIARNAAKTAGMDDHCYASLKEFAGYFCSLPEGTQQKAMQEGVKIPGSGTDIFWVFTAEHARALKARCGKLMSAIKSVESAVPK